MRQDATTEGAGALAAKAMPVGAYMGAYFGGLSLPDWASLLAIVYTLGLIAQQAHRLWCWWVRRKSPRRRASDRQSERRNSERD